MMLLPEGGNGTAFLEPQAIPIFEYPSPRHFSRPGRTPSAVGDARPVGVWKGAFVLTLDLTWLRPGQSIQLSGVLRPGEEAPYQSLFAVTLTAGEDRQAWQSRPLYSLYGCAFLARQLAGQERAVVPWWVVQLDA